jgi:nucleotide-binding universal stress UspA family protein
LPGADSGAHVTLESDQAVKLREIIFATELAEAFPPAASYAVSLAEENQAHLTLLHVIEGTVDSSLNMEVDFKIKKLRQLVPAGAELWCQPAYRVEQGVAAEKIVEIAATQGADLIVLGARPAKAWTTHLKAGTVHEVVTRAICPVLTIRG